MKAKKKLSQSLVRLFYLLFVFRAFQNEDHQYKYKIVKFNEYKLKLIIILVIIFSSMTHAGVTGKLSGSVKDSVTGEPLVGANVVVLGTDLGGATNLEGEFIILNIPPGLYKIKVSYIGYEAKVYQNIRIVVDHTTIFSINLNPKPVEVDEVVVITKTPLVHRDLTSSISVITREQIETLPVSSYTDLLSLQSW